MYGDEHILDDDLDPTCDDELELCYPKHHMSMQPFFQSIESRKKHPCVFQVDESPHVLELVGYADFWSHDFFSTLSLHFSEDLYVERPLVGRSDFRDDYDSHIEDPKLKLHKF